METGTLIAIAGLVITLVGGIVASVAFLVRATWQLSRIMSRVEALEKKAEARDEKNEAADRAVADVQLLKDGYSAIVEKQGRHDSDITELRVKTGILVRSSQGDFGS